MQINVGACKVLRAGYPGVGFRSLSGRLDGRLIADRSCLVPIGGIPFTQVPTTGCGGVSSSDHGYP